MSHHRRPSFDAAFWFQWIIATTLGWIVGGALFPGVALAAAGIGVGMLQWPVLYRRLAMAWQWPLAGALGWLAGWLIVLVALPPELSFLSGLVLGAGSGIAQWLFLRRRLHWAGWWIIISALAWTTGLTVFSGMLLSGAMVGAMTGIALDLLLRYPKPAEMNE